MSGLTPKQKKIYNYIKSRNKVYLEDLLKIASEGIIKKILYHFPKLTWKIIDIGIPPAGVIMKMVLEKEKGLDINKLHEACYRLFMKFKKRYYEYKVNKFLSKLNIIDRLLLKKLKNKMLKPIKVRGVVYSNFMEEAARRISQSIQPISGNLAELSVQRELKKVGLEEGVHFIIREGRTDITLFYPNKKNNKKLHNVEVKNVKLRERGTRGLAFDGDSLIGFFDQPNEFTGGEKGNIAEIEKHCKKRGGFCYIPPETLKKIPYKTKYLKSNTEFAKDMKKFVETGKI